MLCQLKKGLEVNRRRGDSESFALFHILSITNENEDTSGSTITLQIGTSSTNRPAF